ncbi:serine hydrolase [Gordonia polyisoprenivorans]|uniref:serine hydrolase n=1 Tax=Gordonia polyisoprenivorans TaxID=84595 RepID=UPI001AD6C24A|nr:serine hydrolase [Gordonia polyisoprenivorans]QTI71426.1 serine hydrolase [Gordonia polyisoprenivorans]
MKSAIIITVVTIVTVLLTELTAATDRPLAHADAPLTECPSTAASDTSTIPGWLGYIAEHRTDVALDLRTLTGERIALNSDTRFPTASAIKIVHLAAYAAAVEADRVNPQDTVDVGQWQRWYFPLDGGAHREALRHLGIPQTDNGIALDPGRRVSYAQLADVMIRFSDSAAPDLLRAHLGDDALRSVMDRYGISGPVPSLLGLYLGVVDPALRTPADQDRAAQRFHDDPAVAASYWARLASVDQSDTTRTASSITATASSLTSLMSAIADGSFGPGSALARGVLEFQGRRPDGSVLGFKGGSLPGVLTEVFEYHAPDGRIAVGTMMVRNMSRDAQDRDQFTHQRLLLGALTDPAISAALRCVV